MCCSTNASVFSVGLVSPFSTASTHPMASWTTTVISFGIPLEVSAKCLPRNVPAVANTPITFVFVIFAAGLIAGSMPTNEMVNFFEALLSLLRWLYCRLLRLACSLAQ